MAARFLCIGSKHVHCKYFPLGKKKTISSIKFTINIFPKNCFRSTQSTESLLSSVNSYCNSFNFISNQLCLTINTLICAIFIASHNILLSSIINIISTVSISSLANLKIKTINIKFVFCNIFKLVGYHMILRPNTFHIND